MTARQPASRYGDDVACVSVSFYSETQLDALIESISRSTIPVDPVIVVNNAADDALDGIRGRDAVRVVDSPTNRGYGGAVNVGATDLAPGVGWILVVNPDVVIDPTTLERLLDVARTDPTIGALGPRILGDDGTTYPSARAFPSLSNGIGHAVLGRRYPGNPWTRRYWGAGLNRRADGPGADPCDVDWLSGAFILIRREAFEAVDGFDEEYFMFFEDVDIAHRLARSGWRRVFVPAATVLHHGAHSTRRFASAMNRAHHDSAYRYLSSRYSGSRWAPVRLVLRAGLRLRSRLTSR